jgi:hypothetical protein
MQSSPNLSSLRIAFAIYLFITVSYLLVGQEKPTFAQDFPQGTVTPVDMDDLRVFPSDLICDKQETGIGEIGPSWSGITIGESTLGDVEQLLSSLSDDYVFIRENANNARFVIFELSQRKPDIPSSVYLCLIEDVVVVLAVTYNFGLTVPRPNLSDLLLEFGEPDTITWTDNPATRVVFWFEQGFASVLTILPNEIGYEPTFGRVNTEIYFPYQEAEDYESRWPYNQTRPFNPFLHWPYQDYDEHGPENPFDFQAMILTITAEPSQTPMPTLTPRPN